MSERLTFFRGLDIFAGMVDDELEELVSLSRVRTFAAGDPIFKQGEAADGMYIIESGTVRVAIRVPGDADHQLAKSGPGSLLGEVAMLDGGVRSATAVAMGPVSARFFGYRLFQALRLDHRPAALKLVRKIAAIVCGRLRGSIAELGDQICRPMPERATTLMGPLPKRGGSGVRGAPELDLRRLMNIPLFASFNAEEVAMLREKSSLRELARGQVVSREGDKTDKLRIIVRGAIQKRVERGEVYQRLFLIGPGRISGALELIDRGRRPWTAIAREDLVVLEIPTAEVDAMIEARSTLGLKVFSASIEDLMHALRRVSREKVRHVVEGTIDLIGPETGAQRGF